MSHSLLSETARACKKAAVELSLSLSSAINTLRVLTLIEFAVNSIRRKSVVDKWNFFRCTALIMRWNVNRKRPRMKSEIQKLFISGNCLNKKLIKKAAGEKFFPRVVVVVVMDKAEGFSLSLLTAETFATTARKSLSSSSARYITWHHNVLT